jgi:hypothetical protein
MCYMVMAEATASGFGDVGPTCQEAYIAGEASFRGDMNVCRCWQSSCHVDGVLLTLSSPLLLQGVSLLYLINLSNEVWVDKRTEGVILDHWLEHLYMTGDLFSCSILTSPSLNLFRNKFIASSWLVVCHGRQFPTSNWGKEY